MFIIFCVNFLCKFVKRIYLLLLSLRGGTWNLLSTAYHRVPLAYYRFPSPQPHCCHKSCTGQHRMMTLLFLLDLSKRFIQIHIVVIQFVQVSTRWFVLINSSLMGLLMLTVPPHPHLIVKVYLGQLGDALTKTV